MAMEILDAIDAGDCTLVRDLLCGVSCNTNKPFSNGFTPLLYAIETKQVEVAKMLIESGAKVDQICHKKIFTNQWCHPPKYEIEDIYPLQAAVDMKHPDMVLLLYSHGANITQCKVGIHGLVHRAIRWGCTELVSQIVKDAKEEEMFLVRTRFDFSDHFQTAVLEHDIKMVNVLIELGGNINQPHHDMVPVVLAANNGDMRMCLALLNAGAHINKSVGTTLGQVNTPLGMAINGGLDQAVKRLILLGGDVNGTIDWTMGGSSHALLPGSSMLHMAVFKRRIGTTEMLLASGANLNATDSHGNTILHVISNDPNHSFEALAMLKFILGYTSTGKVQEDRIKVNAKNNEGYTALMFAVLHRNLDAVEKLLVYGSDFNLKNAKKQNILYFAIQKGSDMIVDLLVQAGSDINAKSCGLLPIHHSVSNGDLTLTEMLMAAGANIHEVDSKKQTCVHFAVQSKCEELVEFCLEKGLDVNAQSKTGDTPLMLAARSDSSVICEQLLLNGATMNCRDRNQNETALSLSVYFGFEENSRILIMHGADVNIPDKRLVQFNAYTL